MGEHLRKAGKCGQRLLADVVLDTLSVRFDGELVDAERPQKCFDDLVAPPRHIGERFPAVGQEDGSVWTTFY